MLCFLWSSALMCWLKMTAYRKLQLLSFCLEGLKVHIIWSSERKETGKGRNDTYFRLELTGMTYPLIV